jgi:ABC-type phosphate transport system substrate-binding protein
MSSRLLKSTETSSYPNVVSYAIGGRGVVFIVNGAAQTITKTALANAYDNDAATTLPTGITHAVTRAESSGTADTAAAYLAVDVYTTNDVGATGKVAQTGNGGVYNYVKTTSGSLGFVDFGYYVAGQGVGLVSIDEGAGVTYTPTAANIKAAVKNAITGAAQGSNYPNTLCSPLLLLTNGPASATVQKFIDYVQSTGSMTAFANNGVYSTYDL